MGTRAAIGYKTPEGKVVAKYSHYDNYIAGTGKTLVEHYTEARKVAQMVELGDQSYLAPEIFPMPKSGHSFETPEEGVTIFYGRDRGESDVDAKEFDTVGDMVEYYDGCGCEYFYLYANGEWIVNDHYAKDSNGFPIFDFVAPLVEQEIKRDIRLKAAGYL